MRGRVGSEGDRPDRAHTAAHDRRRGQFSIGRDVCVRPRDGNVVRSSQRAFRIEGAVRVLRRIELALEIVIQRISIQKSRGVGNDQAFELINDIQVSVERMNRLFFVEQLFRGQLPRAIRTNHLTVRSHSPTRRINCQRRGRSHGSRILCL